MNKTNEYKFRFSFVIPVYNVENYLAETVDSIIGQTMDFRKYCEIIFVNDGSTDKSKDVCQKYVEMYPDNITYLEQKNSGPGAARNKGASVARGKYINPIDSDDKLSPDAAQEVYNFFESHYDEIDVVTIKWEMFEARTGGHPLNYKFENGTRVINLKQDYTQIVGSAAPSFFKAEVFEKHKFDPAVGRYSEDLRFMGEVLLANPRFGVVHAPTYYYRKRYSQTSSQDGNRTDKFWYLETPQRALGDLFNLAKKTDGTIPKFIQYMVMYELKWRIKQQRQVVLSSNEQKSYKATIYKLLTEVDDDVILAQRDLSYAYKQFALRKKHGDDLVQMTKLKGRSHVVGDYTVCEIDNLRTAMIDIIECEENNLTLYGYMKSELFGNEKIQIRTNGKPQTVSRDRRPHRAIRFLGDSVSDQHPFKVTVPVTAGTNIKLNIWVEEGISVPLNIQTGRFARLPVPVRSGAYARISKDYLLCRASHTGFVVIANTWKNVFKQEIKYDTFLLLQLLNKIPTRARQASGRLRRLSDGPTQPTAKKSSTSKQPAGRGGSIRKITKQYLAENTIHFPLLYRIIFWATRPFYGRVWLLMDRISAADDNAEVFFQYLSTQPDHGRKQYFVIDKKTADYKRIKAFGRVVNFGSFKHKLLHMHAEKLISSEATEFVLNPFFGKEKYVRDLVHYDFIFLQHGIIRDDISGWLNKYNKNIKLFITTAKPEYQSVVTGDYGYSSKEVVLTGQARYDNLKNQPKNKLVIMPTWREDIVGNPIPGTDSRYYNPEFKKTDFYKFWNQLISDKRLKTALKSAGMSAELYLHHTLRAQAKDFNRSRGLKIMAFPYNYPKAKQEGSLLVTDYSSVALDFAFLKKPIVYAQFDRDIYYKRSTSSEGYMNYEENGLGDVTLDYDSTIDKIISIIKSTCKMEERYLERAEDFFYAFDANNCRRIYQAILNMDPLDIPVGATRPSPRFIFNRFRNRKAKPIQTFWWRPGWQGSNNISPWLNFGDELTAYLLWGIWGIRSKWCRPDQAELAATGSILETLNEKSGGNELVVWGSGFIEGGHGNLGRNLDVRAVRGEKTLRRVGEGSQEIILADPGLLASKVFEGSLKKKYSVGIVPHYVDMLSPKLDLVRDRDDYLIIDVLQTPDKVALDISSCKYILSSSLHGLIFADSFGVANDWLPLSDLVHGGNYKFEDYYSSVGRKLRAVDHKILGDDNTINEAMISADRAKHVKHLQKALIKSFPLQKLTNLGG